MATYGLKEMGKFPWEDRENGRERKGLRGKNNKISCQPSPFTMPINEMPINMSKTGQKIVAFNLLFFSVI